MVCMCKVRSPALVTLQSQGPASGELLEEQSGIYSLSNTCIRNRQHLTQIQRMEPFSHMPYGL